MITPEIRKYLETIGGVGGAKGTGQKKARTTEQAQKAARARWRKSGNKKKTVDMRKRLA